MYAYLHNRGGNLLAPHDSIPIMRATIRFGEKIDSLAEACHAPVREVALYPFQLVVVEPPADLTSNNKLRRHSRKMAYEEQD